jgi:hypothetical protein
MFAERRAEDAARMTLVRRIPARIREIPEIQFSAKTAWAGEPGAMRVPPARQAGYEQAPTLLQTTRQLEPRAQLELAVNVGRWVSIHHAGWGELGRASRLMGPLGCHERYLLTRG